MPTPLVFAAGMEAVFWLAAAPRLDANAGILLRELGIDVRYPPRSSYPAEQWAEGVKLCAVLLFPDLPPEQGQYELGLLAIRGFQKTLRGKGVMALLRVFGVKASLERVSEAFQNGNNFTRFVVSFPGFRTAEVAMTGHQGLPHHFLGMLVGGALLCGALDAHGQIVEHGEDACRFRLTWR